MKKNLFYSFFIGCILLSNTIYAQSKEPDCNFNVYEAISYLEGTEEIAKDSLRAVEYLKPCAKKGNPYAQLLMGRLYLHSNNKEDYKKGFQLTKKAAKQDLAVAATDLGDLFKYGIGCELNYTKAKKWYKKADKLGDAKGSYSMGYMHYKGLGAVNQNYKKAIKYFEKSDYPMAKHWLGVSYYFGYGVKEDKEKALQLLGSNSIKNSEVMLDCMEFHLKETQNTETGIYTDNINILDDTLTENQEFSVNQIQGTWQGALMQLDWSGKNIAQTLPLTLSLVYDAETETTNYTLTFNGKEHTGIAINEEDALFFEDLKINLKRLYFNAQEEQYLDYSILSGNFVSKVYKNKTYLTASLDSYVEAMKEPGSRFALVLTKEQDETENGKEISKETALALAEQQDSFIKLYPNPFETDLYIAYTLEKSGFVQVEVSDLHGTQRHVVEQGKTQNSGNYTYYFNGISLLKGMNVITIFVDGKKHTKLIVKK